MAVAVLRAFVFANLQSEPSVDTTRYLFCEGWLNESIIKFSHSMKLHKPHLCICYGFVLHNYRTAQKPEHRIKD